MLEVDINDQSSVWNEFNTGTNTTADHLSSITRHYSNGDEQIYKYWGYHYLGRPAYLYASQRWSDTPR